MNFLTNRIDDDAARQAGAADPRGLIRALTTADRAAMAVLKDDPVRSIVYRAEHGNLSWVLKVYRRQSWWKMLLRVSPAWREWRLARRAATVRGLRVSVPVALVTLSRTQQGLILPYVPGEAMHHMMATCADRELRLKLAAAVGRHVRLLLENGLVNRDCKPSNLIADARCIEHDDLPVMIDPLGVRATRSDAQVLRMWSTLLRTAREAGPVSVREGLTCLRAGMGDTALAREVARRAGGHAD